MHDQMPGGHEADRAGRLALAAYQRIAEHVERGHQHEGHEGQCGGRGNEPARNALASAGTVHTLNDLLDLELPENFEPLELTLDYEVSMRALAQEEAGARNRLQIPGSF